MSFSHNSLKNILSKPTNFNYVNNGLHNNVREEDLFFTAFKHTPIGIVIIDEKSQIFKVNNSFFNYLKIPSHNVTGEKFGKAFSCKVLANTNLECGECEACSVCHTQKCINDILLYEEPINNIDLCHQFIIDDQHMTRWFLTSAKPIFFNNKKYVLMSFVDITKRKRIEDQLTILGITDELTGLYNRRYLVDHCKKMIHDSINSSRIMSLVIIDIDNFKYINDTYGHSVGDDVLVTFADTLRDNLRNCDLVGRYGGEEFIIALPDTPIYTANKVLTRIQNVFKQLSYLRFNKPISFSAGLIQIPSNYQDYLSFEDLLERADSLLYWAKNKQKGTIKAEILM
ncbi:GGDEF domain-containing protein [Clostridium sp. 'deep sea']|uniref:sensor domain-containing diguanylate cyclase n=1 Tax=Clostridium sp. 'deep sea' TaxID=2779445 RepID=UPI001896789F|nr:sensor domain-containing diguanylate cyclase [Clostridium sp. 'deep sea']QOR34182.1 GGDEF domain-containing protein [Clostridium sp. 'deep sea']